MTVLERAPATHGQVANLRAEAAEGATLSTGAAGRARLLIGACVGAKLVDPCDPYAIPMGAFRGGQFNSKEKLSGRAVLAEPTWAIRSQRIYFGAKYAREYTYSLRPSTR